MGILHEDTIIQLQRKWKRDENARPKIRRFGPGEVIIDAGERPPAMYALRSGMLSVSQPNEHDKRPFRGHFDATPEHIAIVGARHFFTGRPSSYRYRAESDCETIVFDSTFLEWVTEQASAEMLMPFAKALILNSDITDIILPVVWVKMMKRERGLTAKEDVLRLRAEIAVDENEAGRIRRGEQRWASRVTLGKIVILQKAVEIPKRADMLNALAIEEFNALTRRHLTHNADASLVHAPSRLPTGKPRTRSKRPTVPPPPPGSPERAAWEASRR